MPFQSDFYNDVYSTAKDLGANDVQAHLAASQASMETGYGKDVVGNSYFGIKAGPSYSGPSVTTGTHEEVGGQLVGQNAAFRSYADLKDSVAGYMSFMADKFPAAWNAETMSDAAKGLVNGKFGAYATKTGYPSIIEGIANKYGKYNYAQNPENVPVPYGAEEDPFGQSLQAQAMDGLSGVVNPVATQEVASAPIADVQSQGLLSASVPAMDRFATQPSAGILSQSDISRAFVDPMAGQMDPSFTANLMGPSNPVVPESVQTTSFTQPDPAMANLGVGTGIYSPEHINGVQAQAEAQLAASRALPNGGGILSAYAATPSVTPAEQAISNVSPVSSVAANPADINGFQSAMAAQRGILGPSMTPAQIAGYQQAANTMANAGMLNIGQQPPTTLSGELPTNFDVLGSSLPALETTTVADQPTVAGPADEEIAPAQEQQQQSQARSAVAQAGATAATKATLGDRLKASFNPGSMIGGILGSATLGPVGGILGGLLGNQMYQGGGILGQGPAGSGGLVGYGPQAAYSVYGGGLPQGSYAYASDGSRVTSRANGDVSRTNTFGVTDTANSYGGYAADWSGIF